MTREEIVLEAIASATGGTAGIAEITVRAARIMRREGGRELSGRMLRDALQSMAAGRRPLIQAFDAEGMTLWKITRNGQKAMKK